MQGVNTNINVHLRIERATSYNGFSIQTNSIAYPQKYALSRENVQLPLPIKVMALALKQHFEIFIPYSGTVNKLASLLLELVNCHSTTRTIAKMCLILILIITTRKADVMYFYNRTKM